MGERRTKGKRLFFPYADGHLWTRLHQFGWKWDDGVVRSVHGMASVGFCDARVVDIAAVDIEIEMRFVMRLF